MITSYNQCLQACKKMLAVKTADGTTYLFQCEIISIKPVNGETVINLYNKPTVRTSTSISSIAERLQKDVFINCYGSIYVNRFYVLRREKQDEHTNKCQLVMKTKDIIPCSKEKSKELEKLERDC